MSESSIIVRIPGTNIHSALRGNQRTFTASVTRGSVYCRIVDNDLLCKWLRKRISIPDNEKLKLSDADLEVLSHKVSKFKGGHPRKRLAEQFSYFREMMLKHLEDETRWAQEVPGETVNRRKVNTWNMKEIGLAKFMHEVHGITVAPATSKKKTDVEEKK